MAQRPSSCPQPTFQHHHHHHHHHHHTPPIVPTVTDNCTNCTNSNLKERRGDLETGNHRYEYHRSWILVFENLLPISIRSTRETVVLEYATHALRQHMLRHAGKKYKCGLPGCPTVLRTASELKYHRSLVHDDTSTNRRYPCEHCPYAAKTKTQLRRTRLSFHLLRHTRLHTGAKPYKCRYCTYACNNLENLRKHVLSKTLHPGKTIYECDFCATINADTFCTNFAKELRAHLLDTHTDKFPNPEDARNYVLNMFEIVPDLEPADEPH
ncbi:hypothetical protein M0802_003967 [Mischocyttarus mexicanus]|nr:hypothetical protein M0802_003967 [Mischocyttarus mexicanus]